MRARTVIASIAAVALNAATPPVAAIECSHEIGFQVLGSGGPIADDARAASGYLLWRAGEAVALVDAGGGIFQRFGEAGASLESLELIAITHFHTDHVADLPALLKGAYFSHRQRPLYVAGPTGNARFPGLEDFLARQFGAGAGAYSYLSGLLDGTGRMFRLEPAEIYADARTAEAVPATGGLEVQAVGVHHGSVPSLAYRFEVDDRRIVISGDQNLSGEAFIEFARGADLLVMPFAIPESAGPAARNLHARPSRIGETAAQAGVAHLVLSHFMARSLRDPDAQLEHVREHYHGPITLAKDLQCLAL